MSFTVHNQPGSFREEELRNYDFRDALGRLQKAFQVLTQAQMAETLGVTQGAVNACIRRETLPGSWLMRLYLKHNLNPRWVLWGDKHKMFLTPTDEASTGQNQESL